MVRSPATCRETEHAFTIVVKATRDSEAGVMPGPELLEAIAGVLLAGDGLHPSSEGARVRRVGNKRVVIDGPFTEAKELIAGYWLVQPRTARRR